MVFAQIEIWLTILISENSMALKSMFVIKALDTQAKRKSTCLITPNIKYQCHIAFLWCRCYLIKCQTYRKLLHQLYVLKINSGSFIHQIAMTHIYTLFFQWMSLKSWMEPKSTRICRIFNQFVDQFQCPPIMLCSSVHFNDKQNCNLVTYTL